MPLYLVPLPKIVDGVTIPPWKTLGGRAFDPDNADDLAKLRMMCDAVKQKLPPAPKPGFFASLFGLGQEDPFTAEYRAKWTRPFEEVVADWASADPPKLIQESDPDILKNEWHLKQLDDFPDFPIDELSPMPMNEGETGNHVIMAVMDDDDIAILFDEMLNLDTLPPMRMLKHANTLGRVYKAYMARDAETIDNHSAFFTVAAADWFRFWAERGHPCGRQRYILAEKHGVVHKAVIETD